jgi:putative ABC transport system substrate-binding protein
MISRRRFLCSVSMSLLAAPRAAEAQSPGKTARIGVLANEPWAPIDGLQDGLRQLGYVDARTITIDYRWSHGRPEQLVALAAELVNAKTDVIVTVGTPAVLAAKRVTTTTPIVMGLIGDPVGSGIVTNIARPDGNITGVSVLAAELEPKRLEVLKELVRGLSRVAILGNATNPYGAIAIKHAERGAQSLGVKLDVISVRGAADLDEALSTLTRQRPQAVLVPADQFLLTQRTRIAESMTRYRLPSAYTYREHVEAGGLVSYSTNYYESFRRSAAYVDKILKGVKPGDLPIEQVDRFELIINLKTAKVLGLTIPPSLLLRVDHVIE